MLPPHHWSKTLVAALLVQYLLPCLKNSAQKMLHGLGPQIDFAFFNVWDSFVSLEESESAGLFLFWFPIHFYKHDINSLTLSLNYWSVKYSVY